MFNLDCSVAVAWLFDDEALPETDALLERLRDDGALGSRSSYENRLASTSQSVIPGLTPDRGPGQAPESRNPRKPLDSGFRRSDGSGSLFS